MTNTSDDAPLVVKYSRGMELRNLGQLSRGLGAHYLEVLRSHEPNVYIAVQWRRKARVGNKGRMLLAFSDKLEDYL